MSEVSQKERSEVQAHRNQKKTSIETTAVVSEINTTLTKLRDRIIPPQPYLLSVPSDVPYRHSSRFINTWYIGTPFTAEEEQLQYVSFLSHQGVEDTLLKVEGGWADDSGSLIEEDAPSPASLSGQNTPVEQPNRKKISLKDYQIKDKTRPSTPTTKPPTQELRKQVMKSEAKGNANRAEGGSRGATVGEKSNKKLGIRESHNAGKTTDGTRSPQPSIEARRSDLPSPRKRRRLSTGSPRREESRDKTEKSRDAEESKHLPLLLSPTLPAQKKKDRSRRLLPELLLPDLPPGLEKLLAKVEAKSKAEGSVGARTEVVKTLQSHPPSSSAAKRLPEKPQGDSNAARGRADSQSSTKPLNGTPRVQSPAAKPTPRPLTRPVTPLQNGVTASPRPRQRHVIILRYGKKNRKRVEALLKFASRPKKVKPVASDTHLKVPESSRPNLTKAGIEVERQERKRAAEASPERPVKKARQLETPEKPSNAHAATIKSPANPTISKPKPDIVTPKKELKSSAMRRIESQDGGDVRTPQGDRNRISTPVNTGSTSQAKASPGPASTLSKEERASWQELNAKCFALGRTLKHEGTSLGPSPGSERTEKDQALSVILLIEALLCFMINHAAQSQARPNVDPGWSTILPYHIFVFRASRKYRHLHGLVIQLGALCRQAIHNHDIDRLAREPLPLENYESAPTPGSDGTTRQIDDIEKYRKKYISFRDQLVLNARELQSAWLEGSRYLSPTLIQQDYPKTWAKRTKDTSKRGFEKLKPDGIGREYYLPLDINSSAFEATRFALTFLGEWSDKEKIDWKPRIEL